MNRPELKVGQVIQEEWLYILRDKRLLAILFIVPLMYTALFGYLYSHQRVTEIKTVVYNADDSPLSRQIIQAFQESETFHINREMNSELELQQAVDRGDAKVGLVIPADLSARLVRGESPPILTIIDGSNMLFANTASRAANEIVSTFNFAASGKKLSLQGMNQEQVQSVFSAIPFRARILYNPTFNYSYFLVFGLIGAILQQVLLLGVSLTIAREKEQGMWGRFHSWNDSPWRLAYAKTAPYFLIGLLNHLTVLILGLFVFDLPFRGMIGPAFALIVSFVLAVLGIGYLASLFSSSQLQATQITMLVAVPSFLLSGFTWPFDAMPASLSALGHALPLTYLLDGIREIFVKGHGFHMVWQDCIYLGIIALSSFLAAFILTPKIKMNSAVK